jgi:hypothetical protein
MGLLDGFFGKRDAKFDWLELNLTTWSDLGTTDEGVHYSLDQGSCFQSHGMVWWKQRIGIKGRFFQYSICASSLSDGRIFIVITRTLSDPGMKPVKKDEVKQMLRPGTDPLFDRAAQQANVWSRFNNYQTPPPIFFYGMSILDK